MITEKLQRKFMERYEATIQGKRSLLSMLIDFDKLKLEHLSFGSCDVCNLKLCMDMYLILLGNFTREMAQI